jgi:hypothetical protein
MVRMGNPKSETHSTDSAVYTPDLLVFSLIIFLAQDSKTPGLNFRSLWQVIAKDATRYFLVIFTAHFVLLMTLIFARVSATVPLSRRRPVTSNVRFSRGRCSFSQRRKSSPNFLNAHILMMFFVTTTSGIVV